MDNNEGFIIEFIRVGDSVKVSAVDPKTGREVSIVAPTSGVTKNRMMELASRKLRYVLDKQKHKESSVDEY